MSIADALIVQQDASDAMAEEGGKILIRDLEASPNDTTVNALRTQLKSGDIDGEVITRTTRKYLVATKDLGTVEPLKDWKVFDGAGANPPAVNATTDPIGRIVAMEHVTAGSGLSALHVVFADFGDDL